jgi:hypothetical protein
MNAVPESGSHRRVVGQCRDFRGEGASTLLRSRRRHPGLRRLRRTGSSRSVPSLLPAPLPTSVLQPAEAYRAGRPENDEGPEIGRRGMRGSLHPVRRCRGIIVWHEELQQSEADRERGDHHEAHAKPRVRGAASPRNANSPARRAVEPESEPFGAHAHAPSEPALRRSFSLGRLEGIRARLPRAGEDHVKHLRGRGGLADVASTDRVGRQCETSSESGRHDPLTDC